MLGLMVTFCNFILPYYKQDQAVLWINSLWCYAISLDFVWYRT